VKLYDKPIQGAGVCAIVGALFFAKQIGASSIHLSSTPTGHGFYHKIGMKGDGIHRFSMKVEKEACSKLKDAYKKAMALTSKEHHSLTIKL
jgi:hypothetical protein